MDILTHQPYVRNIIYIYIIYVYNQSIDLIKKFEICRLCQINLIFDMTFPPV